MDPQSLKLFYWPKDRLRLTMGDDRSYPTVRPIWAAPLSQPNRYLALLNAKGEEVALLPDLDRLSAESRAAVETELQRRYLTATVQHVTHARVEYGATYWHVETNRGPRDFVTQSLQENAQWLSADHLLLIDVDGNRFEIPSVSALDARSAGIVRQIL